MIYEKYFQKDFDEIVKSKNKDIKHLLNDKNYLISGDFYGIQKFIFEGLSTTKASQVLRAKSAFVQIFTNYIAKYICYKLEISEEYILSSNAGKFEIISPKKFDLSKIQKEINEYFLKNFYGLSGVSICSIEFDGRDFHNKEKYRELRDKISKEVEKQKYKKFDLVNEKNYVLEYDKNINNQNLCKICNIRKITDKNCDICNMFVQLGKDLVKREQIIYSSKDLGLYFGEFETKIIIDKKLKSYVKKDKFDTPMTFENLAKNSCREIDTGIEALAILKADVDSMGNFLKDSDVTDNFENFDCFSKTLDNFFSLYVPKIIREKYPYTYTIFAGGDDLFLVGAWDEVLELAREIHKEFRKFIKNELSISFGIAIAKPSHPISHLADYTEELLEEAKGIDSDKNAINLFRENVKWKSYLETYEKLKEIFDEIEEKDINTSFLYRLLEVIELSKKVKYEDDVLSTIWKSKLSYSFARNMDKKYFDILGKLSKEIENNPSETKMFLSEYIYKRRDK